MIEDKDNNAIKNDLLTKDFDKNSESIRNPRK